MRTDDDIPPVPHLRLSRRSRPGITAVTAMTTPQLAAPVALDAVYADRVWTPVSCYPAQTTWRLDHAGRPTLYAKVGRTGAYPGLTAEAARTRWARPYLPVPGVVATGTDGALEWLVTAGLPGLPATDTTLGEPASIVVALAEGLRRLHQRAPAQHCPFQFRLPVALDHVRRRAAAGRIDPAEDFDDDHRTSTSTLPCGSSNDSTPTTRTRSSATATTAHPTPCSPTDRSPATWTSASSGSPTVGGTSPSPPAPSPATTAPASRISSSTPTARGPTPAARPSTASSTTSPPERATPR